MSFDRSSIGAHPNTAAYGIKLALPPDFIDASFQANRRVFMMLNDAFGRRHLEVHQPGLNRSAATFRRRSRIKLGALCGSEAMRMAGGLATRDDSALDPSAALRQRGKLLDIDISLPPEPAGSVGRVGVRAHAQSRSSRKM